MWNVYSLVQRLLEYFHVFKLEMTILKKQSKYMFSILYDMPFDRCHLNYFEQQAHDIRIQNDVE